MRRAFWWKFSKKWKFFKLKILVFCGCGMLLEVKSCFIRTPAVTTVDGLPLGLSWSLVRFSLKIHCFCQRSSASKIEVLRNLIPAVNRQPWLPPGSWWSCFSKSLQYHLKILIPIKSFFVTNACLLQKFRILLNVFNSKSTTIIYALQYTLETSRSIAHPSKTTIFHFKKLSFFH